MPEELSRIIGVVVRDFNSGESTIFEALGFAGAGDAEYMYFSGFALPGPAVGVSGLEEVGFRPGKFCRQLIGCSGLQTSTVIRPIRGIYYLSVLY